MKRTILDALLVLVVVAACGGGDEELQDTARPTPPAAQQGASTTPAPAPARPAAPAPDPNALAAAELSAATGLRTVQVASFLNAETAQKQAAWLTRAGVPAWTTTAMVGDQQFTRVRIGVATTGADARAIAERVRGEYQWPAWITMVEDRSGLTGNTLVTSRNWSAGK